MGREPGKKKKQRTFQPQPQPKQDEMWCSSVPHDVMWGIYARQSTQAQMLKNAESTEMQTEDLITWLIERGVKEGRWKLFDADLGVSGTLPIMERTALQELVELIKADKIKAVLVYQISRLFRDDTGVEYNTFAKICKEHSCVLVTADGMVFNFNNRMHLKMFRFLVEYAAEYIPQQIGLLHAARLRKARRGLYAGLGVVPRGYIVDYNRHGKTFRKFILYQLHVPYVLGLFERFYALKGDLAAFCREVEEMPFVFPHYEDWVDSRNIRDKKWKKVPGGYHITRHGLISMLTNPVYIGWWIVKGDIVSMNNHDPLIPPEKQYLFWFAFDCLSEYTVKGEKNEKRRVTPQRFYQKDTSDQEGLLKGCIQTADGDPVRVHLSTHNKHCYRSQKRDAKVIVSFDTAIDIYLIDNHFADRLFAHLRETHDFDSFRQWANEVTQKQKTQAEIIDVQLEEVELQQEAVLDEKLQIRMNINQQVREDLAADPMADADELKAKFEKEAAPDLERLEKRSERLKERKEDLLSKKPSEEEDRQFRTATTLADFQTEVEILAKVWHKKPIKERRDFINLLVERVTLSIAATHWIRMTIEWSHPLWQSETLFIYRQRGDRSEWIDDERNILKALYGYECREAMLEKLPHKSWDAIKKEARLLGLSRPRLPGTNGIDDSTTWSDYRLRQELALLPNSRDTVILVHDAKVPDANYDPLLVHRWYRQP